MEQHQIINEREPLYLLILERDGNIVQEMLCKYEQQEMVAFDFVDGDMAETWQIKTEKL